jgi:predicted outer membrane lipoprotein
MTLLVLLLSVFVVINAVRLSLLRDKVEEMARKDEEQMRQVR